MTLEITSIYLAPGLKWILDSLDPRTDLTFSLEACLMKEGTIVANMICLGNSSLFFSAFTLTSF